MPQKRIKVVSFDFDDTLVRSEALKRKVLFKIAGEFEGGLDVISTVNTDARVSGVKCTRHTIFRDFALGLHNVVDSVSAAARARILNGPPVEELGRELADRYSLEVEIALAHAEEVPGAQAVLSHLAAHKFPTYINSATPQDALVAAVTKRGWSPPLVTEVLGSPNAGGDKLDQLRKISTHCGLEPNEILHIGDGDNDQSAASRFGCPFVRIRDQPCCPDQMEETTARNMWEVGRIICRMANLPQLPQDPNTLSVAQSSIEQKPHVLFNNLPHTVWSRFSFSLQLCVVDAEGDILDSFDGEVQMELVDGIDCALSGGGIQEITSGMSDYFNLRYEGVGAIKLRAVLLSGSCESDTINVEKGPDELAAEVLLGGETNLTTWMQSFDAVLGQPGSTTAKAAEVTDWLLLGGTAAAQDAVHTNTQGVTHILNCCEPWCADGPNSHSLRYAGFEALDAAGYRLLDEHYAAARLFLDDVRETRGRCLVHCAMGVNRSALVCAAYLIDRADMDLLQVVRLLKAKRGCILCNISFRLQLLEFAAKHSRLGSHTAA